ncbi:MAG: hypothetical protein LBM67_08145 [Lentimicrobiaceae bacterium]|nr:hypothetical protein [Lentimicrobiaceae bacterium]
MMNRKFFIGCLLLLVVFEAKTQYYLSGNDPASIKWKQLKTKNFRVIFPDNYTEKTKELAKLLDTTYYATRFDLQSRAFRTDIIIHSKSSSSNGMVTWAPRRVDLYPVPSQKSDAQDWFKQLATHELRHVAQIGTLRSGFGNVVHFVLGEQGTATLLGLFVPTWFLEGDAVAIETALSYSGRGRSSQFSAGLRAQLFEKGFYDYDKAYFGSYKDFTPDIYELGYFLVAHNREKYGWFLWSTALRECAQNTWALTPFGRGIKKTTGIRKNQLYKETMYDLFDYWSAQYDSTLAFTKTQIVSPRKKTYTNYASPKMTADGSIIALKSDFNEWQQLVQIKNGTEKKRATVGVLTEKSISTAKNLIVWSEILPHERWSNENYAVIAVYDLETKKYRYLTDKTRYFAPDLSVDARSIVVSEIDEKGDCYLTILCSETGNVISRNKSAHFLSTPKWHPNGKQIFTTATGETGKAFFAFDVEEQAFEQITPFTFTDIQLSDVQQNGLIFEASYNEVGQIYLLDFETKQTTQLTNIAFAASDATFQNDTLLFLNYTSDGNRIEKVAANEFYNKQLVFDTKSDFYLADQLSQMSIFNIDEAAFSDTTFEIKNYNKLRHLFNIHSWAPLYIDVSNLEMNIGASILSQNTLSSMVAGLGYEYDLNEETGRTSFSLNYTGLFPEIDLGASTGLRRNFYYKWHETKWHIGLAIPLTLNYQNFAQGMRLAVASEQFYLKIQETAHMETQFQVFSSRFSAYRYRYQGKRELQPRWGQNLQIAFNKTVSVSPHSEQFFVATRFFFPGIFQNNGINLYASYQYVDGFYDFSNLIASPRGYDNLFFDESVSLQANYCFPLAYPDLCIPTVFLLQRVRSNLFADYFNVGGATLKSFGAELFTDWRFFNLPTPITIGLRMSYAVEKTTWVPEMLFSISFSEM